MRTTELYNTCTDLLEQDSTVDYNHTLELLLIQLSALSLNKSLFAQELFVIFQLAKCDPISDAQWIKQSEKLFIEEDEEEEEEEVEDVIVQCVQETISPIIEDSITARLQILRDKWQPVQRTPEWYVTRRNMITASNAYKAFGSQAAKNSLIYEKCKPLPQAVEVTSCANTESPMHWGVKYEPVSVMWYEYTYKTKIGEFGCIPHDTLICLGASPDGINIDPTSSIYGRMLEIKNVVSRVITGIPKTEYAAQMQIQMEVCELDECDFLETKFIEFESAASFYAHINKEKLSTPSCGCIMQFYGFNYEHIYKYMPLDTPLTSDAIREWQANTMETELELGHSWIKNIYWNLITVSCVLVKRDREWFQTRVPALEELWDIVLKERETGYEHRAPKKRPSKGVASSQDIRKCTGFHNSVQKLWAINAMTKHEIGQKKIEQDGIMDIECVECVECNEYERKPGIMSILLRIKLTQ